MLGTGNWRSLEDRGFTVNDSLIWKEHVELLTGAAIKFFQIKNTLNIHMVSTILNLQDPNICIYLLYGAEV